MSRLLLIAGVAVLAAVATLFTFVSPPVCAAGDDPPKKDDAGKDPTGLDGRTGSGKARLLKEFGGSEASEEAVMLGLAWLTQMQRKDGSWSFTYDGTEPAVVVLNRVKQPEPITTWRTPGETAASTGLAILSFLGAGQSHKAGRYQQTVQAGLNWLIKDVSMAGGAQAGSFRSVGTGLSYCQGIATLALCEAYGLTHDKSLLPAAQSALDYIQRAQAANGSWGYTSGAPGDTSIVGWMIQALHAATLAGDLKVDSKTIDKTIAFLNGNSTGANNSVYGYRDLLTLKEFIGPATSLSAIGLLMRYYIDGWRTEHPGFAAGVKGLMSRSPNPQNKDDFDMYYYYYATQVVRFYGRDEWTTWNEGPKDADGTRKGGMQGWLIALQDRAPANRGSWPPDVGVMGPCTGRLGTTALCLLTLEVYYRYSPENANDTKKP